MCQYTNTKENIMQFNSYLFLFLFLPVVLLGYFGLYRMGKGGWARLFLSAMSLLFFAWKAPWNLVFLLCSIIINWLFYLLLLRQRKRWVLAVGITANLLALFYYKYFNFCVENLNGLLGSSLALRNILQPMGISFYTFQQIAWLVDMYRDVKMEEDANQCGFLDYLLFSVYFPKMAMGPILLYEELIPQLKDEARHKPRAQYIATGLMMLSVGLFKKVVLAEAFAPSVTWGFSQLEQMTGMDAWLVMLSYTFQLYFDFSGYCDMAMGISAMLGITLPQNFDSPYKALSPVEFWRGWHMTLTRFLRRYVYFPLGGSRKGTLRTYLNIMIVFLISGIWHGASWTFILWGLLHGAAQCLNRAFKRQWERLHPAFQWMATFLFVNLSWVVFRADSLSEALRFFKKMANMESMVISPGLIESFKLVELPAIFQNHRMTTVMLLYLAALCLVMNGSNLSRQELRPTLARSFMTAVLLVWSVVSLTGVSAFIYFQF